MKGLLIKDIFNLRKNVKTTLLFIGFFAMYSYALNDPIYMISMATMLSAMMVITSMAFDDMSKWDRYACAMPIKRKEIVGSKYVLSIGFAVGSVLISSFFAYLLILPKSDMSGKELLLAAYVILSISLLYVSVVLPLLYKYGVERTRIISIAVFAVPSMLVFVLFKMGLQLPSVNQLMFLLKASPFILLLVLLCSAGLSYRIFKNKEL